MTRETEDNLPALTKKHNADYLHLSYQYAPFYLTPETLLQHCSAFHARYHVTTWIKYGVRW